MKFLKNFFGSKKEKVEEKTKVVLSMPLFKGEETFKYSYRGFEKLLGP